MSRVYLLLALVVAIGCLFGLAYCKGGSEPRKALKAARKETAAVAESAQISRDTAERVDKQGAAVRERASRAEEVIDEAAKRDATGGADTGVLPADVLREIDEAYAATVRARCRVQRTDDCRAIPEGP